MDREDREILQHTIASRVGKVVCEIIRKEECLEEDVHIDVFVGQPSCYFDDKGEMHTGKVITVAVDVIEDDEEDI